MQHRKKLIQERVFNNGTKQNVSILEFLKTSSQPVSQPPQVTNPSQVTYLQQMTQPSQVTPLQQVTQPSQVTYLQQMTQPSQVTPLQQVTQPSQVTHLQKVTQPSQVTPLQQVTQPSQPTHLPQVSQPSQAAHLQQVTHPPQVMHAQQVTRLVPSTNSKLVTYVHPVKYSDPNHHTSSAAQPHIVANMQPVTILPPERKPFQKPQGFPAFFLSEDHYRTYEKILTSIDETRRLCEAGHLDNANFSHKKIHTMMYQTIFRKEVYYINVCNALYGLLELLGKKIGAAYVEKEKMGKESDSSIRKSKP